MEVIHVPGPPKEAFNKNRPISDLIRAQVNHLKHLEANLPANLRQQLPQHEITTEDDAARYIGAMTSYFRSQPAAAPAPPGPVTVPSVGRVIPIRPPTGLAIAAAGATPSQPAAKPKASAAKKSSSKAKAKPKAKKR